jgi:excinuclease UvrABC nuclease subunit
MIIQFNTLIENSPKSPGVYMMYDADGTLLYVGKAKNLNARLRQYSDISKLEWHKRVMRTLVTRVQWQTTANESDALILEEHLIKNQKPKYNIILTDGKMYPMLELTKHAFPRLVKFRARPNQKRDVFGPYPSVSALNETIKTIQKVCQVRTCTDSFMKNRTRPCLLHQIGRCSAPCVLKNENYNGQVSLARKILSGDTVSAAKELSMEMTAAAAREDYEKAAELRDKISALSATGKAGLGTRNWGLSSFKASPKSPVPSPFNELESWLGIKIDRVMVFDNSHLFGKNPVGAMVVFGRDGFIKNEYRHFKLKDKSRAGNDIAMMEEFLLRVAQKQLAVSREQIAVKEPENGTMPQGNSDFANCGLLTANLIIVDGGRSQWNIAKKVLGADAAVLGVVKGEVRDGDEHFILPNGAEDRTLAKDSALFLFLRRVRDEAHRFAITFHRRTRAKGMITSALDEIEGIGAARKRALLHHFGSTRQIADARVMDLMRTPGISKQVAQKIYDHFH